MAKTKRKRYSPKLSQLEKEADELVAIMVASINTARSRT